jgi:hypothetical protein
VSASGEARREKERRPEGETARDGEKTRKWESKALRKQEGEK